MLIVDRTPGTRVRIITDAGEEIVVLVASVRRYTAPGSSVEREHVKLGIEAPRTMRITRDPK